MTDVQRIKNRSEFIDLARRLGVRPDWHEPDEQEVTARVEGQSFDNAGTWPVDPLAPEDSARSKDSPALEMHVVIQQGGEDVAVVNLATLCAWAAEPPARERPTRPVHRDTPNTPVREVPMLFAYLLDRLTIAVWEFDHAWKTAEVTLLVDRDAREDGRGLRVFDPNEYETARTLVNERVEAIRQAPLAGLSPQEVGLVEAAVEQALRMQSWPSGSWRDVFTAAGYTIPGQLA